MSKKMDGPTPNGGSYATITYFDDKGKIVDESIATRAIGCEFDENDELICESWIILKEEKTKVMG
ncbi:MAG: hypothetical protein E7166_01090 [Firmicutes bacterium]|nr:hypothetical protein [Bacillota bacterium]